MTPNQERWTARAGAMIALREKGLTLQAIGDKYDLTRERVRQIIKKYASKRLSTGPSKTLDSKDARD